MFAALWYWPTFSLHQAFDVPLWHHHGGEHGGGVSTFAMRLSPLTLCTDCFFLWKHIWTHPWLCWRRPRRPLDATGVSWFQAELQGPQSYSLVTGEYAVENCCLLESQDVRMYDRSHISASADRIFAKLIRVMSGEVRKHREPLQETYIMLRSVLLMDLHKPAPVVKQHYCTSHIFRL